jgi:hypothetical protein
MKSQCWPPVSASYYFAGFRYILIQLYRAPGGTMAGLATEREILLHLLLCKSSNACGGTTDLGLFMLARQSMLSRGNEWVTLGFHGLCSLHPKVSWRVTKILLLSSRTLM